MKMKERFALFHSSAECSTGTADCANYSYAKRSTPCKAAAIMKCFHLMRKVLAQKLALIQCQSQVKIAREFRAYISRKKAGEGLYPTTVYLNGVNSDRAEVLIYGNFSTPSWNVIDLKTVGDV